MHHQQQPADHAELKNYDYRIIVAGTRGYNDYDFFSTIISGHVSTLPKEKVIFVSGKAKTGADDLIIRWCKEHGYPWVEFEPDWDDITVPGAVIRTNNFGKEFNVIAGYTRNTAMSEVGTELITFWDGKSDGTIHMRRVAKARHLTIMDILIEVPKKESKYGGKSQGSRKDHH